MTKDDLTAYIQENFSGSLEVIETSQKEPYFIVPANQLVDFARFLHDDNRLLMTILMNLSGIDTGERFEIVYNVCSYRYKHRAYFKVKISHDHAEVDTVQRVWRAADWYEREVWELFGIAITGHNNLRRFLLPDDWDQGFPMRKGWEGRDVIPFPEV